jgi:hypothetical protein
MRITRLWVLAGVLALVMGLGGTGANAAETKQGLIRIKTLDNIACGNNRTCAAFKDSDCNTNFATPEGIDASILDVGALTAASSRLADSKMTPEHNVNPFGGVQYPRVVIHYWGSNCSEISWEQPYIHFGAKLKITVPKGTKWMIGWHNYATAEMITWTVSFV